MASSTSHLSRRRFLGNSAIAAGTLMGAGALLEACGPTNTKGTTTITVMSNRAEFTAAQQALFEQQNPTIKIQQIEYDPSILSARLSAGNAPDVIRSQISQIPYLVSRGLALNLDPYFAKSTVINTSDLLPINDAYRFDGKVQGQGPRYGMVKDWSQDAMYWYDQNLLTPAGITIDPATPSPTISGWPMASRLPSVLAGRSWFMASTPSGAFPPSPI